MTCLGAHELTDVRPAPLSRRQVLLGGLVLGLAIPTPLSSASPAESSLESLESLKKTGLLTATPKIRAREEWAGSKKRYAPKRRMCHEREGDVRYLLAHHGATTNSYSRANAVDQLLRYYDLHKRELHDWPDIAYNFLVDRFGPIWEGRAGSLERPVIPSASYGNQGFDQIVCWIGDHSSVKPTRGPRLHGFHDRLAGRPVRHRHAPRLAREVPLARLNRWPEGARVTTRTIEGHRKMSLTACPGDAAYPFVRKRLPKLATRVRRRGRTPQGRPRFSQQDRVTGGAILLTDCPSRRPTSVAERATGR